MIISTSVTAVNSLSLAMPIVFFKHRFIDRTVLSNIPPHHGALSMLNVHCTPTPGKCYCTSSYCIVFSKAFAAALIVLALSEIIFRGSPRLAENLLKLQMKDEVYKSGTISRCTARTMQQVYRQGQTFPPTVVSVPLM